ncbi:MAG: response regulator [Bradymonadia bacterium]
MATILTADDSMSIRQLVSFTLRSAGHEVIEARDGYEALEKAKSSAFHLLLTDVNMPRMDGISLVRALRSQPQFKFTPMLLLTTESAGHKKQEGKAAGATGWLVKPFDPEQLLATVKKVLG